MVSSAPAILDLRSLSTAQPILGSRACTNAGHHKQRSRPDFCELTGQFPTHVNGSSGPRQPWNSQLISPIRCVLTLWSRQFLSQGEGQYIQHGCSCFAGNSEDLWCLWHLCCSITGPSYSARPVIPIRIHVISCAVAWLAAQRPVFSCPLRWQRNSQGDTSCVFHSILTGYLP